MNPSNNPTNAKESVTKTKKKPKPTPIPNSENPILVLRQLISGGLLEENKVSKKKNDKYAKKDSSSKHKRPMTVWSRKLIQVLQNCIVCHRWSAAAKMVLALTYEPDRTSQIIWMAGFQIFCNHPNSNPQLIKEFSQAMCKMDKMFIPAIILKNVMYFLECGDLAAAEDALHLEDIQKKIQMHKLNEKQKNIALILQGYKGVFFYIKWLEVKNAIDDSRNYVDNRLPELEAIAKSAIQIFEDLFNNSGNWDIFITKYLEIMEHHAFLSKAIATLEKYCNLNPLHPNGYIYLYDFLNKFQPQETKRLLIELRRLAVVSPNNKRILNRSRLNDTDISLQLEMLFTLLDYPEYRYDSEPWEILWDIILKMHKLPEKFEFKKLGKLWKERADWWSKFHFAVKEVIIDDDTSAKVFYYKSLVLTALTEPDKPFSKKVHSELLNSTSKYLAKNLDRQQKFFKGLATNGLSKFIPIVSDEPKMILNFSDESESDECTKIEVNKCLSLLNSPKKDKSGTVRTCEKFERDSEVLNVCPEEPNTNIDNDNFIGKNQRELTKKKKPIDVNFEGQLMNDEIAELKKKRRCSDVESKDENSDTVILKSSSCIFQRKESSSQDFSEIKICQSPPKLHQKEFTEGHLSQSSSSSKKKKRDQKNTSSDSTCRSQDLESPDRNDTDTSNYCVTFRKKSLYMPKKIKNSSNGFDGKTLEARENCESDNSVKKLNRKKKLHEANSEDQLQSSKIVRYKKKKRNSNSVLSESSVSSSIILNNSMCIGKQKKSSRKNSVVRELDQESDKELPEYDSSKEFSFPAKKKQQQGLLRSELSWGSQDLFSSSEKDEMAVACDHFANTSEKEGTHTSTQKFQNFDLPNWSGSFPLSNNFSQASSELNIIKKKRRNELESENADRNSNSLKGKESSKKLKRKYYELELSKNLAKQQSDQEVKKEFTEYDSSKEFSPRKIKRSELSFGSQEEFGSQFSTRNDDLIPSHHSQKDTPNDDRTYQNYFSEDLFDPMQNNLEMGSFQCFFK